MSVWSNICENCIGDLGLRYEDLYALSIGEYEIKLRSFHRNLEYKYDNTRLILMELINGNPHIKKSSKIRNKTQIFKLSIDGNIKIEATKVSEKEADSIKKMGYKISESFIEKEDGK